MASAFIKAQHNKPKLFSDAPQPNDPNETTTDTIVFSSKVPERHRNETRAVSEAMFGGRRKAKKSVYEDAESAAQIEQRLRNREIGVQVRPGQVVTADGGTTTTTITTTTTTVHLSPTVATSVTAPNKNAKEKSRTSKPGSNKGPAPDEVFRFMRTDETFLALKKRFDESRAAPDALACAKLLVGQSAVEAEKYFKEALACDPRHLKSQATYAVFLETITKDFDRAEKMYQAAAMSGERVHIQAYAAFLRNIRGDNRLADKIERAGGQDDDGGNDDDNNDGSGHSGDGDRDGAERRGHGDDGGDQPRRHHHRRRHHRH